MLYLPLLAICATAAQARSQEIRYTQHNIHFSSLSPLFRYTPAESWSASRSGVTSATPGANVSFDVFGEIVYLWGNQSGTALEITPDIPAISPHASYPNYHYGNSASNVVPALFDYSLGGTGVLLESRQVSLQVAANNGTEVTKGAYVRVREVQVMAVVPTDMSPDDPYPADNAQVYPAVTSHSARNPFYADLHHAWNITTLTSPWSTYTSVPRSGSGWEYDLTPDTWPLNAVLSTDVVGAPLHISMPRNTTILQLYGSVGPHMGIFELRLVHRPKDGMVPVDVANQGLVLRVDAERAVETSSELLAIAWLDPRFHYDAEMSLVDDRPGKLAQIHGMGFKTYMRDPSLLPPDWREEYNARSARGAEGFSARTILVASVLVIALVALAIVIYGIRRWRSRQENPERAALLASERDNGA